jgi:hypothetical protein
MYKGVKNIKTIIFIERASQLARKATYALFFIDFYQLRIFHMKHERFDVNNNGILFESYINLNQEDSKEIKKIRRNKRLLNNFEILRKINYLNFNLSVIDFLR